MPFDDNAPILVGAGQYAQHVSGLDDALDPVAMMAEAIRLATADAGLASLPDPGSLAVVSLLSWRYGNPALLVAELLGVHPGETALTTGGGNSPQSLVNHMALRIQRGELSFAVLTGGEAWRTRMRARKLGTELAWPKAPESSSPRVIGDELDMTHPGERKAGVFMPVQVYPMFETAIRAAAGRTVEEQLALTSSLWSRFSGVAAGNPNVWSHAERTPEEIRTPAPDNRMIGFPYTKYMNSNNDVDMAAALIMCSAGRAHELGIPESRWVYPHAGSDCHEHAYISNRWSFAQTPAIELGGRTALQLAGLDIGDIDIVDLYSCFPSAVQLGAQSLGLSLDRQLTRTGGLPFAGGPWNNYVMHAIATVMDDLRARPGEIGLVWANGGFATKHAFGIYSTTPPAKPFAHGYPQAEIDAMPQRELAEGSDAAGPVTIEAYTVMHDRHGEPETALAACLLSDGRRAWGTSADRKLAAAMCRDEWVGRAATLDAESVLTVP